MNIALLRSGIINSLPQLALSPPDELFIKRHIVHGAFIDPMFFTGRYILPQPFIGLLHQYNTLINQTNGFTTSLMPMLVSEDKSSK